MVWALAAGQASGSTALHQARGGDALSQPLPNGPADALASHFPRPAEHDVTRSPISSPPPAVRLPWSSPNQQIGLLKRSVQLEDPGQPLRSTYANGGIVLRCETPTSPPRFG